MDKSSVFGFPEHKFHVVYNAAESDFMIWEGGEAFREKVGIQGSYVLNVANVEPRKNQLRFMEALRKERPDLTLVVVGNVRDSAYARACENAGEGRWKAVGSLPYASRLMRSAMGGCEFFAMPSLLETPSIAAIEAAAAGARIVLTGEGSTREYFGDTVIYVDPGSDDSMRRGIRLAPETDPERSMWLARDRYLWPKVMPAMLAVYASLLPNRVSAQ